MMGLLSAHSDRQANNNILPSQAHPPAMQCRVPFRWIVSLQACERGPHIAMHMEYMRKQKSAKSGYTAKCTTSLKMRCIGFSLLMYNRGKMESVERNYLPLLFICGETIGKRKKKDMIDKPWAYIHLCTLQRSNHCTAGSPSSTYYDSN